MADVTKIEAGSYAQPHYWLGYLSGSLEGTLSTSAAPEQQRLSTERALAEYRSSPVHRPREIVAFAVVDRRGECYRICPDEISAIVAQGDAQRYLWEAGECGHPSAPGWVAERLPFRILTIDAEEREALLEEGTPVLEREP